MDFINIGSVKIEKTAALAPMAGVADRAFREICKEWGACYTVTEMASSKGLCYKDLKTPELLEISPKEHPAGIQLFGEDPEFMGKATKIALDFNPEIIDINMGCPAPKIVNNKSGSALMKTPEIASEIIKSVVKNSSVPVTVKFRKGWDKNSINAIEFAQMCEESGASAICIHGRTREEMYSGNVDMDIIKEVKKAVKIPVIANGDIVDIESAKRMYDYTNCDLIMIGRGACHKPWIFEEIRRALYNLGEPLELSTEEKMKVMKDHITRLCQYKGEKGGMTQSRKHVAWYLKGFPNGATLRRMSNDLRTLKDLDNLIEQVIK